MLRPRTALLAAAIVAGVLLRVVDLGGPLLWHDEVTTRVFTAGYTPRQWHDALYTPAPHPVTEVVRFQRASVPSEDAGDVAWTVAGLAREDPQHPPLYYLLARAWVAVFGDSVVALRSLSALAGIAALAGLFWFACELFASRRVAWTAVALGAVSPFFVLYSQEAREYALWGLLLTLHGAALLRAVRATEAEPPRRRAATRAWALYAAITTVALYTSLSTVGPILAHIIFIVWRARARVRLSAAGAMAVAAALFSPWLATLIIHREAFARSMRWSQEILIPLGALLKIQLLNLSRSLVDLSPDLDTPLGWAAALLALSLVLTALVRVSRRARPDARALLALLIAVPLALLLGPDLLLGGIRSISARYLVPTWLGVLLLVAALLGREGGRHRVRLAVLGVVLAVGLASDLSNARTPAPWSKGTSVGLPAIARLINATPHPLVAGGMESYSPATLLALSNLLRDDAAIAFRTVEQEQRWTLPAGYGAVFLLNPIPPYREALERRAHVTTREVYGDLFLTLWRVERGEDDGPRGDP